MSADLQLSDAVTAVRALRTAVNHVICGKAEVVDLTLTAMIAGGHVLLQDVPGVGKTTLASSLARAVGGVFSRVQGTSDLLPGDVTGVSMLDPRTGELAFREGPIFGNVVLVDEINRTNPKTQSALFEAMEEHQVTVDGTTRALPQPFMVIATQNPFDDHGTFGLPESQLDRFLVRLQLGYPDREAERAILQQAGRGRLRAEAVLDPQRLLELIQWSERVRVSTEIEDYLLDIVRRSRRDSRIVRGVSPRGAQALYRAIRAWAVVQGRDYAIPEDVLSLAVPVLAHRIIPRHGSLDIAAAEEAVRGVLDAVPAPA